MLFINIFLACIVGLPALWVSFIILNNGLPVLGNARPEEALAWWAPVLFSCFPWTAAALSNGYFGMGVWILALAPYVATASVYVCAVFGSFWLSVIWVLPCVYYLRKLYLSGARGD